MLDKVTKETVKTYLEGLKSQFTLQLYSNTTHSSFKDAESLLGDLVECSDKIMYEHIVQEGLEIRITKDGKASGIIFKAVPGGHEFSSFLLAILNLDGIGKNIPDAGTLEKIKRIKGAPRLRSFISLSCTNCPDVVQALNLCSMIHPDLEHEIIDGSINKSLVEDLGIVSVPTVMAGDDVLHVGRGDLATLLNELEAYYGTETGETKGIQKFDQIIIGGGPAGASAAIYSSRKGLSVAIIAQKIGGQANETLGIENFIGTQYIKGTELAVDLREHLEDNAIDILENRNVTAIKEEQEKYIIETNYGEQLSASSIIIATGAAWRQLGIPGETDYIGNGVAFCARCDGPFFKGKKVAVIGGGNSGLEAAIDLSKICTEVYVIEFLDTIKADTVLLSQIRSLPNVKILMNTETKEILGDGKKIHSIKTENRSTKEERILDVEGVFIQIGLKARTDLVSDLVELNKHGEILIDDHCRTSKKGIYAAGDCTSVPYKQIVIAMGEGAKAALAAHEDMVIRGGTTS